MLGRSLVIVALLLFAIGVAPSLALWWLWRRNGPPSDRRGMAFAALAFAAGVAAMVVLGPFVGFRPTTFTYPLVALAVLLGSWKELNRDSRRVSGAARDAADEDEEVDRFRGGGTSLG